MTTTQAAIIMTEPRPAIPSQRELDENYFASTLYKIEAWLQANPPSAEFRRVLLRTSQTAFAAAIEEVN